MSNSLTKSKYVSGLQCLKLLWIKVNDPNRIPKPTPEQQAIFDQGNEVGKLATKLFPSGTDLSGYSFVENIKKTQEATIQRKTIFEAGIMAERLYARADILVPVNNNMWDIVEVKSSTTVKDENIPDLAFQKYCYEKAGLKIKNCFLLYINNQYIRQRDIEIKKLFHKEDVTELVRQIEPDINKNIQKMLDVIDTNECPVIGIGPFCKSPYECPLLSECYAFLPKHNVCKLRRCGAKSYDFINNGILGIKDIPDDIELSISQQIQKYCIIDNKEHIDKGAIREFLSTLEYPLYYLDFETINPAVPLFGGTRPYQQIAFQFSLHIVKSPEERAEHYSFLAEAGKDPRKEFLSKLKEWLGTKGSIVVYNQGFEKGKLRDLGEYFGDEIWVENIFDRMVDLLEPFRKFDYYHPSQEGSASLKKVLPAVTGKSYDDMAISNGGDASSTYLAMAKNKIEKEKIAEIRKNLEEYCCLDTEGMVWIVEKLKKIV